MTAGSSEKGADMVRRDTGNPNSDLPTAVALWPALATRDYKGTNGPEHLTNGTGRLHLDQLPNYVVHVWSAPRASDGEKGSPNQSFGAGGMPLAAQATQWMSPRTARGGYTRDNGDPDKERLTLEGQATLHSILPDPPISTVGEESSHIRRSLNPLFVEWLMGWPRGWTLLGLTPPASNGCACSATALSRFRQRMRGALSQLGSRAEVPAQQSLF